MSRTIRFPWHGKGLPPYKLLKKHPIGYNAVSIEILFLVSLCLFWGEHTRYGAGFCQWNEI